MWSATFPHEVAVIYMGTIVEISPTEDLFQNPSHPYTKALLASMPGLGKKDTRVRLVGEISSPINPPPGCRLAPRCPIVEDACRDITPELREMSPGHRVACLESELKPGSEPYGSSPGVRPRLSPSGHRSGHLRHRRPVSGHCARCPVAAMASMPHAPVTVPAGNGPWRPPTAPGGFPDATPKVSGASAICCGLKLRQTPAP